MWGLLAVALAAPLLADHPADEGARLAFGVELAANAKTRVEAVLALGDLLESPAQRCAAVRALRSVVTALPGGPWVHDLTARARATGCPGAEQVAPRGAATAEPVPWAEGGPPTEAIAWVEASIQRAPLAEVAQLRQLLGWAWSQEAEAHKRVAFAPVGWLAPPSDPPVATIEAARRAWLVDLVVRPGQVDGLFGLAGLEWDAGAHRRALALFEAGLAIAPQEGAAAAVVDLVGHTPLIDTIIQRYGLSEPLAMLHADLLRRLSASGAPPLPVWRTLVAAAPAPGDVAAVADAWTAGATPRVFRHLDHVEAPATMYLEGGPLEVGELLAVADGLWGQLAADPAFAGLRRRVVAGRALGDALGRMNGAVRPSPELSAAVDDVLALSRENPNDVATDLARLHALLEDDDPAALDSAVNGARELLADRPGDPTVRRLAMDALLAVAVRRLRGAVGPAATGGPSQLLEEAVALSIEPRDRLWHRVDTTFVDLMSRGDHATAEQLLRPFVPAELRGGLAADSYLRDRLGWLGMVAGQAALDGASPVEALDGFARALATHPHAALMGLGTLYVRYGHADLAYAAWSELADLGHEPGLSFDEVGAGPRLALARLLVQRGRPVEAQRTFPDLWPLLADEVARVRAISEARRAHGDPEATARVVAAWRARPPSDPILAAGGWLDLGLPEEAWRTFAAVLREAPGATVPWGAVVAAAQQSRHLEDLAPIAEGRPHAERALWSLVRALPGASPRDLRRLGPGAVGTVAPSVWLADAWLAAGRPKDATRVLDAAADGLEILRREGMGPLDAWRSLDGPVEITLARARVELASGLPLAAEARLASAWKRTRHPRYAMALIDLLRSAGRTDEAREIALGMPDQLLLEDGVLMLPAVALPSGRGIRPLLPE